MEERMIATNGVNLHVVMAGPETGEPVILLHGFPEFWYGWRHQMEDLAAQGFRVIVPDQRGYNLSDKPPQVSDYRISTLAKDITGLADALGYETFYLAGHDWGAAVAWWVATIAPERVRKLVICNVPYPSVMRREMLGGNWRQLLKSWYMFAFQMPFFPEWSASWFNYTGMSRAVQNSGKPSTFSEADMAEYRKAWGQKDALKSMINWYRAMFRNPPTGTEPDLQGGGKPASPKRPLPMPILILWGEQDQFLSKALAQASLAVCANGQVQYFPDATHWIQHDERHAVSQHLAEFFA